MSCLTYSRHWFANYGAPGSERSTCVRCGKSNPKFKETSFHRAMLTTEELDLIQGMLTAACDGLLDEEGRELADKLSTKLVKQTGRKTPLQRISESWRGT